ncbi:MAG: hypothetical protein H6883_09750 [Rhodobiaceae bacterium]|nr:hypothetical protein [Rhodobiaceae bacterium]MCC0056411.1 hypothetical protein [Rhodobiaceae bacterium]
MSNEPSMSVPRSENVGTELGAKPIAANAAREAVRNSLDHLKKKRASKKSADDRKESGKSTAERRKDKKEDAQLNEGLEESFPASDVPASINPTR